MLMYGCGRYLVFKHDLILGQLLGSCYFSACRICWRRVTALAIGLLGLFLTADAQCLSALHHAGRVLLYSLPFSSLEFSCWLDQSLYYIYKGLLYCCFLLNRFYLIRYFNTICYAVVMGIKLRIYSFGKHSSYCLCYWTYVFFHLKAKMCLSY